MGFLVKAVKSVVKAVVGIVSKVAGGIFGFSTGGGKKTSTAGAGNLNKSLMPEAYRKIAFGNIAAELDVRFWQVWGLNGTKFDEVIALATHRIHSVQALWFEEFIGIDASNVAVGKYAGNVSREIRLGLNNQTALSVGDGSQYDANSLLEGCAAIALKWLPDEKKLPGGIPSRYTQIIEGALVYDPRRDSTQPGGSGTHRDNDRSTWQYAPLDANGVPIGRNNALQALWYLLGWYIPTKDASGAVIGEMLVAGRGIDPQDINMASFIAGANACEVAAYYTDMTLSTGDDHTSNEDKITADGLIGRLIDPGGLWSYYANVDDTANIALEITDADIADSGAFQWNEYKGMSEQFNQVGGKFVNPSNITLYQPFPYPLVRDANFEAALGVKRRKSVDFEQVLDNVLAQRLARLYLNQGQYQGELQADFLPRAIKAQAWSVVRYVSERWGWTKLFRVWRHDISSNGGVSMLLKEIHPSIWQAGSVATGYVSGAGSNYNALQEILPTNVAVTLETLTGADGTIADGFRLSWDAPPSTVRRSEIRYRLDGSLNWASAGHVESDTNSILIGPLFSGAVYETAVRHISINEIASDWVFPTGGIVDVDGKFTTGLNGNVNASAIATAGITIIMPAVIEIGHTSAGALMANELPRNVSVRVSAIGQSISLQDNVEYSATFTNVVGTIDSVDGSPTKGLIVLTQIDANEGYVDVVVTFNGVVNPSIRSVVKKVFTLPASGNSKFQTDSDLTAISTTSFSQISDTATLTLATGEKLVGSGYLDYWVSGTTSASRSASVKWGYRIAGSGSAFTYFGNAIVGSNGYSGYLVGGEWIEATPGSVNPGQEIAGLAAGSYEVALFAAASAAGRTLTFDGTVRIDAKV